jgi:hypothetical protein
MDYEQDITEHRRALIRHKMRKAYIIIHDPMESIHALKMAVAAFRDMGTLCFNMPRDQDVEMIDTTPTPRAGMLKIEILELEALKCAEALKYEYLQRETVDWPGLRKCTGFRGTVQKPYTKKMFHVKHCGRNDRRVMKRKNYIKQLCRKNG